jgi:hypothetical protein
MVADRQPSITRLTYSGTPTTEVQFNSGTSLNSDVKSLNAKIIEILNVLRSHQLIDGPTNWPTTDGSVMVLSAENAEDGDLSIDAAGGHTFTDMWNGTRGIFEASNQQSKFGNYSLRTKYTSTINYGQGEGPASSDFAFGSGDFTVEFHYYVVSRLGNQYMLRRAPTVSSGDNTNKSWWISDLASTNLSFVYSTSGNNSKVAITANHGIGVDQWYHVAFVRNGDDAKFFVDGTQVGSTGDFLGDTIYEPSPTQTLKIDNSHSTSEWFLDNIRVTKGSALYTSNFTPPTEPFDDGTGTSIVVDKNNVPMFNYQYSNIVSLTDSTTGLVGDDLNYNPGLGWDADFASMGRDVNLILDVLEYHGFIAGSGTQVSETDSLMMDNNNNPQVGYQQSAIANLVDNVGTGTISNTVDDTSNGYKDDIASLAGKINEVITVLETHGLSAT